MIIITSCFSGYGLLQEKKSNAHSPISLSINLLDELLHFLKKIFRFRGEDRTAKLNYKPNKINLKQKIKQMREFERSLGHN